MPPGTIETPAYNPNEHPVHVDLFAERRYRYYGFEGAVCSSRSNNSRVPHEAGFLGKGIYHPMIIEHKIFTLKFILLTQEMTKRTFPI